MSNNNSPANNSRLVHVTEQVSDPIRVPVVLGNEVYVVSQQDKRNIIDTRMITWEKLPVNCPIPGGPPRDLNNIFNVGQSLQLNPNCAVGQPPQLNPNFTQPFQPTNVFNSLGPHIMCDIPQNQLIAPIQTQLDWEMRSVDPDPPNKFCYSKQTSTSDLRKVHFCLPKHSEYSDCPKFISRGVNITEDNFTEECSTEPSAYEQVKWKKISDQ